MNWWGHAELNFPNIPDVGLQVKKDKITQLFTFNNMALTAVYNGRAVCGCVCVTSVLGCRFAQFMAAGPKVFKDQIHMISSTAHKTVHTTDNESFSPAVNICECVYGVKIIWGPVCFQCRGMCKLHVSLFSVCFFQPLVRQDRKTRSKTCCSRLQARFKHRPKGRKL